MSNALKRPEPHPHTTMRHRKAGLVKVFFRPDRNGILLLTALAAGASGGSLHQNDRSVITPPTAATPV